jgi:hypothetical protein
MLEQREAATLRNHETKNLLPTTQSSFPAHTSGRSVSAAARSASEPLHKGTMHKEKIVTKLL